MNGPWTVRAACLLAATTLCACHGDDAGSPGDARGDGPASPTWESVGIERAWLREGFGEVRALGVADFDGDGSDDIVLGGRGIALIDAAARANHRPRWSLDWIAPADQPLEGGDNDWVYALELVNANADGVPDVLAVTSAFDAYLIDGATGTAIWHRLLEGEQLPTALTLFDGDGDSVPDFFPVGGRTAYAGATGEPLWEAPLGSDVVQVRTARLGDGTEQLLLTTANDQIGGFFRAPNRVNAVHAFSPSGEGRWTALLDSSPSGLAAGDLDGDGSDEVVAATWGGGLAAFEADGTPIFDRPFDGAMAAHLVAADLDGDGAAELAFDVVPTSGRGSPSLAIVEADGTALGSAPFLTPVVSIAVVDLDGVPPLEVVAGSGSQSDPWGELVALEPRPDDKPLELWRKSWGGGIPALAPATVDGTKVLLAGGDSGWLLALAPGSGETVWPYASGGFVRKLVAADLDGDGADEVVSGDDGGNLVAAAPADGRDRWVRRMDNGFRGGVTALAAGTIEPGSPPEVIAGGYGLFPEYSGIVERFDGEGARRFSVRTPGEPDSIALADLDGDGTAELVIGEWTLDQMCHVSALRADGTLLWTRPIAVCDVPHVAAGDVDGDGRPEIAVGTQASLAPPYVALLDAGGEFRWSFALPKDTWWIEAASGGFLAGGRATEARGHVTKYAPADGEPVWEALFPAAPDPETPDAVVEATSMFGALVPDRDGDGHDEVVAGTTTGAVYLLDGATGADRWQTRVEPEGQPIARRHFAGPFAYVPGSGTVPPFLAAGQSSSFRMRSRTLVLDLEGREIGSIAQEGEGHGIAAIRFDADRRGVAVGAGLGIYAIEPRKAP